MAEYLIQDTTLTAIANAIRAKTGKSDELTLDAMKMEIEGIEIGVDTSDATATAEDILSGKTAYVDGEKVTGSHICEGAELNFEVIGGTTQPTNPKENTIWVNTANDITNYIFSATAPESPAEGAVWFVTSSDGSLAKFEALADDTVSIVVYPDAPAYQYIGGQWVSKPTSLYQFGSWTVLSLTHTVIPNVSDYPISSWTNNLPTNWSANINTSTGVLTFVSSSFYSNALTGMLTSNSIDITNFNTLTIVGTFTSTKASTTGSGTAKVEIGIDSSNSSSSFLANTTKSISFSTSNTGTRNVTINTSVDISSITGDNYIKICLTRPNTYNISANLEITSLILSS